VARLLVVDDARVVRSVLAALAASLGHEVAGEAASEDEAVAAHARVRPDLVLLDVGLPDAFGAIARILAADPDATIVACASLGQEERLRRAIASGARRGLVRPFVRSELAEALASG
jgi:two-component system chemotaxis response regulator CheY